MKQRQEMLQMQLMLQIQQMLDGHKQNQSKQIFFKNFKGGKKAISVKFGATF